MKKNRSTIINVSLLLALLTVAFTFYFWLENRYALAQHLKETNENAKLLAQSVQKSFEIRDEAIQKSFRMMDQNREQASKFSESNALRDRILALEKKFGKSPKDPVIREELRHLYSDKKKVDDRLKELQDAEVKERQTGEK